MSTLEFMQKELVRHVRNYEHAVLKSGAKQSEINSLLEKVKHYKCVVELLKKSEGAK